MSFDQVDCEWIADDRALDELLDRLQSHDRIALDTEFHREKTYFPRLALIQLAWADGIAIVDPLTCDASKLIRIFGEKHLIVLHAAQQDLDVMTHAMKTVPKNIFDTQIAAGFLGYSTPSLASLVNSELKLVLPKGDRLTDWLRRPLSDGQKSYAASDVEHLLEIHDRLMSKLEERGRLTWAADACEELRVRKMGPGDPADAWQKQKDVRALKPELAGYWQLLPNGENDEPWRAISRRVKCFQIWLFKESLNANPPTSATSLNLEELTIAIPAAPLDKRSWQQ